MPILHSNFWDKPANVSGNRSFEEEAQHQLAIAGSASSSSGTVCQLLGLFMVLASPLALLRGWFGIPVTVGLIAGGASTAAIGSVAHSAKRIAKLNALQAWLKVNDY